jgi:hypothetical protein
LRMKAVAPTLMTRRETFDDLLGLEADEPI